MIASIVYLFAHFYNGTIDLSIQNEQKTVVFKPLHSLEFGIMFLIISILLYMITFYLKTREEKLQKILEKEKELALTPDEKMTKLLENNLKHIGTFEEEKFILFFDELGNYFQNYKIVHADNLSSSPVKIELRGQYNDYPVRLRFSYQNELLISAKADIFPAYLEIYKNSGLFSAEKAKECSSDYLETYITDYAKSYSDILQIAYNPEKIPVHKDITDPWNKEDILRVFVGKGIYIEGLEYIIDIYLAVFKSFTEEFRIKILAFMADNKIANINLTTDEIRIALPSEQLLLKPLTQVRDVLDFILNIAGEFESIPITGKINFDTGIPESTIKVRLNTCKYCTTKYPLMNDISCPNCGAPYS
ncbi:MAG: hypothetical protein U0W24_18635 [Bacteroidales bacterium]